MKKYIPVFVLTILLAACGGEAPQKTPPATNNSTATNDLKIKTGDTLYGDTVPPAPMQQLYKQDTYHNEVDSIYTFAQHWVGRRLDSCWTKVVDLTGDGKKDTAIAQVAVRKNTAVTITYSVHSGGKIIYSDTAAYSREFEDYYRNEALDSMLYDKYAPYSTFWYACSLLDFVEQRNDLATFADNPTTKSLFVGMDDPKDWEAFRTYLKTFKGATLKRCDALNCYGKIWYGKRNKFIALYEP